MGARFPTGPLQAYGARLPAQPGRRASDAEPINDNIYASDSDPAVEEEPRGLLDRLYRERNAAQPMRGMPTGDSVPTTKNRYS